MQEFERSGEISETESELSQMSGIQGFGPGFQNQVRGFQAHFQFYVRVAFLFGFLN